MGQSRAASAGVAVDFANSQPAPPTPTRPVTEIAGAPSDPAKARGLIEQDATRIAGLSGSGLSMGTVLLRAKGSVQIEGLASAASGQWYLRSVNHRFEKEDTGKAARQTYRTSFEATR